MSGGVDTGTRQLSLVDVQEAIELEPEQPQNAYPRRKTHEY